MSIRLKTKFDGAWVKGFEVNNSARKDGVVITEIIYLPLINGEIERQPVFNPGAGRPLRCKRWVARLGDVVSGEHGTRKAALDEIKKKHTR